MRWSSTISLKLDSLRAAEDCAAELDSGLEGSAPDLLMVFPSGAHSEKLEAVSSFLRERFPDAAFTGCSAAGVIGGGHEAEGTTALSVTAATLPGVDIHRLRLAPDQVPGLDVSPGVWRSVVGIPDPQTTWSFILLADPFSGRVDELLRGLDYAYPGCPKIGGLASGSSSPGGNALFLDEETHVDGVVGVALSGNVRMDTLVAQGGRAVGPELSVTRSERNVLLQLDGRPALEVFQPIYEKVSGELAEGEEPSFFVGIRAEEVEGGPGDYLIRNIVGIDPQSGAMAVGSLVRDGQSVRFHLLNPRTAEEDLRGLLLRYRDAGRSGEARGALLFSCNGRGQNLFGVPDHDTNLFQEILSSDVPVGGLFCAGEIGPVGASTHVHGFTSSFGMFRPSRDDES